MSAGDIDNHLGSAIELSRLMEQYPAFREYARRILSFEPKRASIPFGAGISEDGQQPYLDEHLDTNVPTGTSEMNKINVDEALIMHECIEWALRKFCGIGVDYQHDPAGHRLANTAEKSVVESLGLTWEAYNKFIEPQIMGEEIETLDNVPSDLALYPYRGTPLERRLKEAMHDSVRKESSGDGSRNSGETDGV